MAFAQERDELRAEVRRDTPGTVAYWCKVDGVNSTATSAYYAVFDSSGRALQAEQAATITPVTDVGSRLDLSIPSIDSYEDGARVDVRFTVSGVEHYDTVVFDVVRVPYLRTGGVSLNDLREERADADVILDRIGQRLGYSAGDEAQTQAASVFAYRARGVLDSWLRASSGEAGKLRAALIVDRRSLLRIERLLALHLLFLSLAVNPGEGDDETSALCRYYESAARSAYQSLRLDYDLDEDGVVDTTPKSGVVYVRRVQGG